MMILKRRLAAGEITLDEYERLTAVLSGAPTAAQPADAAERRGPHAAG